jgi:hypothetical protein
VTKVFNSLKNKKESSGPYLLKNSRIRQCINERRHLPIHIKKSVVKPVYKKETKENANHYH